MASYGWMINLSGKSIPVYSVAGGGPSTTKIGNLTKNECFVEGTFLQIHGKAMVHQSSFLIAVIK